MGLIIIPDLSWNRFTPKRVKMDRKIPRRTTFRFTESAKHQMIQEMLSTGCTKQEIWQKYTGRPQEHGKIVAWMRELGYNPQDSSRTINFDPKISTMARKKTIKSEKEPSDDNFENLQLKKRIAELEKQLKDTELKAIAFSTMIDIAEKEFKIPIRKKYNTKP